ncbi:MAG: UDP-3-O-[3-hydroxymyristoyl] N-acetylglucosamine deacetylase [Armatimonadota bacterium]|nr:MAG: UDP-3-O-[3-hydroxymyristoyl] N-acetylglucosamine deacetylase [Armatimonadota bacterium]
MAARTTLARPITTDGVGLHSGKPCLIELSPARSGEGKVFTLADAPSVTAVASHVVRWERCVALGNSAGSVYTVEHLLSALHGMGVHDVHIKVNGPEIPAMDGSALGFVKLIDEAGLRRNGRLRRYHLRSAVWVQENGRLLIALPSNEFRISCVVDYSHPHLGRQFASFRVDPETFRNEIAPARTFCFEEDIKELRAAGLAMGGSAKNALVIGNRGYTSPLVFADEVVRHKVLDLIGDTSLVGVPFTAHIVAVRPGHRLNVRLARELAAGLGVDA